jgi:hypothetical protein
MDSWYFQQCFQNRQGDKDHSDVECPESNVSVGGICLHVLHSTSLGVVDRGNVIMFLGISASQISAEDNGRKVRSIGSGSPGSWWATPSQKSRQGQYEFIRDPSHY